MRKPLTSGQKGAQGEKQVARHLRWLSKKQYIVLSDLMLLQGRRLTQIDHVVVSVYGIFVIETKNYHGTITGTERSSGRRSGTESGIISAARSGRTMPTSGR